MRRLDPTALILCLAMLPMLSDFTRDVAAPAWEMLLRAADRARRPNAAPKRRVRPSAEAGVAPDGPGTSEIAAPSADAAR